MKTTQAWGWLAAGVLALGLNGFYHDGGFEWAHRVADRAGEGSQALAALAEGRADRFLVEVQALTAPTEDASSAADVAMAQVRENMDEQLLQAQIQEQVQKQVLDNVQSNLQANIQARIARCQVRAAQAQATADRRQARLDAERARINARVAAQRARLRMAAVEVKTEPAVCPLVRVRVPRTPRIRIPAPAVPEIHMEAPGAGPI